MWIVTWISHLAIKAPARRMSNDCNISISLSLLLSLCLYVPPSVFSLFNYLFFPPSPFLSGSSARRSIESSAFWQQPVWRTHQRWLKNTVPIFCTVKKTKTKKRQKKGFLSFFLSFIPLQCFCWALRFCLYQVGNVLFSENLFCLLMILPKIINWSFLIHNVCT